MTSLLYSMKNSIYVESDLQRMEKIAEWMDNKFLIPGTSIRFGLDSLLGLLPGLGDTSTLLVTLYLLETAKHHNLPQHIKSKIYLNALIDWFIGLVPILGDVFDIGWKANLRSVALIRDHMSERK